MYDFLLMECNHVTQDRVQ